MRKKSRKTEELQTETAEETAVSAVAEAEEQPVLNTAEHAEQTELPKEKLLTPKQKRIRTAVRFLLLNVGIFMMSLSVYFFQTPNNFTLGGVAGIAILLHNTARILFAVGRYGNYKRPASYSRTYYIGQTVHNQDDILFSPLHVYNLAFRVH